MKTKTILYIILLVLTACTGLVHPEKDTLQFKDIQQYAEMADASYQGDFFINQKYQEAYEVKIYQLEDFEVKYFVLKNHLLKKQYIVVRGTDNLENAITDLLYLKTKDPRTGLFIHSGFLETTQLIYQRLILDDPKLLTKEYETVLVGHSLGGAIVGILGTYILKSDINLKWVITFGQPKFTSAEGIQKIKELPFIRVVNQGDLVPMVPPTSLLSILDGEYQHGGLEIFLSDQGTVKYTNVGTAQHDNKKGSFWEALFEGDIDYEKHLMGAYIRKINKLINKAVYITYEEGFEWAK